MLRTACRCLVALVLPAVVLLTAASAVAEDHAARTVLAGVYTPAQADHGKTLYQAKCASCHRADLAGFSGPPLKGDVFMDRWREFHLNVLFDLISGTMPMDAPNSLKEQEYVDVLAFLLQANEIPPGAKPLRLESLSSTLLVGKNGPQPLPSSAPVEVVGCFTLDSGNGWFLTQAAEPARTLNQWEISEEESKAAAVKALGDQLFRLMNLSDLPGFISNDLLGEKTDVKGILVRQPGNERINVTSLKPLGMECVQ